MLIKSYRLILTILPLVFVLPASADVRSNIELAKSFYRDLIQHRQLNAVDRIIAEHYVQHSPNVADGREGVRAALEYLASTTEPIPDGPSPILRVIGEADFVVLHLRVAIGGNELSVIDLFRVSENQLAEHWEAMEPISGDDRARMTNGTRKVDSLADTAASKALVRTFYEQVFLGGKTERIETLVHGAFTQHASDAADGRAGLRQMIEQKSGFQPEKIHRLVAQGDFVVVQMEGHRDGAPSVDYDILRTEGDKIAEMWRVQQQIPSKMPHSNGML